MAKRDAKISALVGFSWAFDVVHVCCMRYVAEVVYAVVQLVSVYVVNVTSRPRAMHVEPSKAMREPVYCFYADVPVPNRSQEPNGSATGAAGKRAGFGVVSQMSAKLIGCNIAFSHDAVLSQIG